MKHILISILAAWFCVIGNLPSTAADAVPADCGPYKNTQRYDTCQNARKFGVSLNAAALAEWLAERDYAVEFCGAKPDPAEQRHTQSILSGSANLRALYDAHTDMLRQRCVYDPDGWCRNMGFQRR